METGNQQAGYGRSRGKWNKRKQQERLAQKESQKLVEPQKQQNKQSAPLGQQGQEPERENNGKKIAVMPERFLSPS